MFRRALDMATQALLPNDDAERPNRETRHKLHLRLDWLFEHGKLPEHLQDLASVVRIDGNDGAHRGTLGEETAEDLVDFTERLLTQIYTEPMRVRLAKQRADERKAARRK